MSYSLIKIDQSKLTELLDFAQYVYEHDSDKSYPEFKFTTDIDEAGKRKKYYSAFVLPAEFDNNNIRQAYAVVNETGELCAAVGVRRFEHWPCWSVAWILSPKNGLQFVHMFRKIMQLLTELHESLGFNEFLVTYPSSRESAYSKIMLPFRERYYTFVECTVSAKTRSPYAFIHTVMGQVLHPHDMNLRRYILRRPNTEPPSQGGAATRLAKTHD